MWDLDSFNLPGLDRKGKIFVDGIESRVSQSLHFLKTHYSNFQRLNSSIEFIECHCLDAFKSDFEDLARIGYFPATETVMELDHAIKHALIGSYKSAFADLRRALELTLTSIFLTSECADRNQAIQWINSQANTPFVSEMLKKLIKHGRYKNINDTCNWSENLKQFYWDISDFAHNKGQLKSYRQLNETALYISGTSAPSINIKTLSIFSDAFISCVEEIVVMLSLYNPIILVALPVIEKFGSNPPLSGFFMDIQSEAANELIPGRYKFFFEDLKRTDIEVKGLIDWFNAQPDLTKDQIEEQIRADNQFFSDLNNGKYDNEP